MTEPLPGPSWPGLVWAALPMLGCMGLLAWRGLGQVRSLVVASIRLIVQLILLGEVLDWVFEARNPWIVGAIVLMMLSASAYTVGTRLRRGAWGLRAEAFGAMTLAAALVMAVATRLAMRVEPWYDPRTVLPLLGIVLGNSVNGVSLAAERLEADLRAERDRVELRLSLGATSRQAAASALQAAIRAALTPTIHSMMIAGIVAVPGMMSGQVLAGADVQVALRYQILVYFLIAGTVGISVLILLRVRLDRYFTPADQLRTEALASTPREPARAGPRRKFP